jgi:hypothetical protein
MPVYNQVLCPDPINMTEVGMDGKRVIGIDIGKRWLDVAREGTAGVERHANETPVFGGQLRSGPRRRRV